MTNRNMIPVLHEKDVSLVENADLNRRQEISVATTFSVKAHQKHQHMFGNPIFITKNFSDEPLHFHGAPQSEW